MNEEQSKRIAEAAEAVVQAADALAEAREDANDKRFESEVERERTAAAQALAREVDAAGKRMEDAVRKATVAAAVAHRSNTYLRFKEAAQAARDGRRLARTITDQDGSAARRARGDEALARLEEALEIAASFVFVE